MARIYDLLLPGSKNAIPRADLLRVTGLDDRAFRRRVQLERLAGFPILTDCATGGYFRPASPSDSLRFARSMRRRAVETLAVAEAVELAAVRETGQMNIFEFIDLQQVPKCGDGVDDG